MKTLRHPGHGELTKKLVRASGLQPGATILDLGCGTGRSVEKLREAGYACEGMDLNPPKDIPGIYWGDMQGYDETDCRDGLLMECALSQSQNVAEVLKACYRGLKPEGLLMISDMYLKSGTGLFISGRPASLENWRASIVSAGFQIIHMSREDEAWKDFILEWLWAGKSLTDLGAAEGCSVIPQGKVGYFTLVGRKEPSCQSMRDF